MDSTKGYHKTRESFDFITKGASLFFTTFDKLLMKSRQYVFFSFSEDVEIFPIQVLKEMKKNEVK